MSNVLETIKATLQVAFGLVVLVLIIWTFPDIYKAIEKILTTETVSKLKGPGFEVDLNETNVNDALLQQSVATDSQSPVFPAMVPSRVVLGFGDASPSLVMLSDHEARSMI